MRMPIVRDWESFERVVGTWLLALIVVLAFCLVVVTVCRVVAVMEQSEARESVGWVTGAYPDPPCEWCGQPMDGHSCQCEGGGL